VGDVMALRHIDENKRLVDPEKGEIFRTDNPKEYVMIYTEYVIYNDIIKAKTRVSDST